MTKLLIILLLCLTGCGQVGKETTSIDRTPDTITYEQAVVKYWTPESLREYYQSHISVKRDLPIMEKKDLSKAWNNTANSVDFAFLTFELLKKNRVVEVIYMFTDNGCHTVCSIKNSDNKTWGYMTHRQIYYGKFNSAGEIARFYFKNDSASFYILDSNVN